jgi:hypothetical protein
LSFFDERTRIAEFEAELPRPQAEARALACCISEWMIHNPVRSAPDRCIECGGGDQSGKPLLPFGTEANGHAWLHSACWETWYPTRMATARAALAQIGIQGWP